MKRWSPLPATVRLPVSGRSGYVVVFQVRVFNIEAVSEKGDEKQNEQKKQRLGGPVQKHLKNRHFARCKFPPPDDRYVRTAGRPVSERWRGGSVNQWISVQSTGLVKLGSRVRSSLVPCSYPFAFFSVTIYCQKLYLYWANFKTKSQSASQNTAKMKSWQWSAVGLFLQVMSPAMALQQWKVLSQLKGPSRGTLPSQKYIMAILLLSCSKGWTGFLFKK